MATAEERRLANEAILVIEHIRSNMRRNALGYKQEVLANIPTASIATKMKADADQFQRRLKRLRVAFTDPGTRPKLISGLVADGVTRQEIVDSHTD